MLDNEEHMSSISGDTAGVVGTECAVAVAVDDVAFFQQKTHTTRTHSAFTVHHENYSKNVNETIVYESNSTHTHTLCGHSDVPKTCGENTVNRNTQND